MLFGLLVAAITMTCDLCLRPSISVSSCETIRLSTSPCVFSRFGAIASNSSMKMIAGAFFSASSNALRRLLSDSPASLLIISGPLIRKKKAPVSFAKARDINVFPVPGGPYNKIPRGGLTPIALKRLGCLSGSSTISFICANCLRQPPISSYPIELRESSSSSLLTGSPSQWMTVSGATIQKGDGSVSTTLNSTALIPPLTMKRSPLCMGRYASKK